MEKYDYSLLEKKFWCTLDYGVEHAEEVSKLGFDDYDNYISMISVKPPTLEVLTTMQH